MGFIIKVLITALAVYLAAYLLPGVSINSVQTTVVVALVLALLNTFIRPILVLLTIPISIATLGLFLLVINALMVKWASQLVTGFHVAGWWPALLVSLIVSIVSAVLGVFVSRRAD